MQTDLRLVRPCNRTKCFHDVAQITFDVHHMNRVMRKPALCICKNKGTDQLRSNCAADQRLWFRHRTISVLPKSEFFKPLAASSVVVHTARFVSDLVENSEDRFLSDAAHIEMYTEGCSFHSCFALLQTVKGLQSVSLI